MSIETLAMPRSSDRLSPESTLPLSTTSLVSAGFVALAVAMGIGRFAFTPVLPMMRHEGALSITGAAWLAFANYLAGAILALLNGIRANSQRLEPLTSLAEDVAATKRILDRYNTALVSPQVFSTVFPSNSE